MEHLRRDILAQSLSGLWLFRKAWAAPEGGFGRSAVLAGLILPLNSGACPGSQGGQ